MDTPQIIEETLKILPIAASYMQTLDVPKVMGQEVVKESVKKVYAKVYNWVADKFKNKNSEPELQNFVANPDSADAKEDVTNLLKMMLRDDAAKQELVSLLQTVKPELTITIHQKNEKEKNEQKTTISKVEVNTKIAIKQENIDNENNSELTIGR